MNNDPAQPAQIPSKVQLQRQSKQLQLHYSDGKTFVLPCEYLRVFSPSAEVRGHSPEQAVLQTGKAHVNIERIERVGNYALQLFFSDGHESGIYSWTYLYQLGEQQSQNWQHYLQQLQQAGASRDPDVQIVRIGN